jgi:hypothetical protein
MSFHFGNEGMANMLQWLCFCGFLSLFDTYNHFSSYFLFQDTAFLQEQTKFRISHLRFIVSIQLTLSWLQRCQKIYKKVDVFQKHVLLMPMCTDLHWILYVVVNPHQCGKVLDDVTNGPVILCLDSLGEGVLGVESSIRDFLEKEWTKSTNHAYLAFPFSKKNIPLLIPKGSLLVFPVFFGMHYHQYIKVPNKFSSNCCFSQKTRERLRLWRVCVSVYACYCSFISGFSKRNTFAKKRWMGKFR